MTDARIRILIAGAGFVGLYAAPGLEKRLRPDEAEIILVSREGDHLGSLQRPRQPFREAVEGTDGPGLSSG